MSENQLSPKVPEMKCRAHDEYNKEDLTHMHVHVWIIQFLFLEMSYTQPREQFQITRNA